MGRYRKPGKEIAKPVPTSLVASAARMSTKGMKNFSRSGQDTAWQNQIWDFYHTIGEFRFACDWVGATLSKAIMFAKLNTKDGPEKITEGAAADAIDELFRDEEDRAEMLRLIGIHFTAAGECYLVAYDSDDPYNPGVIWQIVASTQFRYNAGKYYISNEEIETEDHDNVLAIRLWRPDPVDHRRALSPSRAVMSILGEIARLTDHVAAQVDSRLAGAGILLMPSEMTFPTPPPLVDDDGSEIVNPNRQVNDAESLMDVLQETMAASIEDRSDPSALVPIVITAPGDVIDKVTHMTFWSELDEHAIELRNEAIRRLALGMDMPPEVLQGNADSNHWSAWQADEAAIKSHTEPLLKIITTSLSVGYLRPRLMDEGVDNAEHYAIGVDTSEMRLRPNRSKEALELYNLGELSGEALLRETGFDESDKMDDDERSQWFLRKVAAGSTTPELVEGALRALGVPLGKIVQGEIDDEVHEGRPAPSLKGHPVRDIPDQAISERRKELRDAPEGLIAAGDQLVVRALERTGNRLKNKFQLDSSASAVDLYRLAPSEAVKVDDLLTDAWSHAPRTAGIYGVDVEKFTSMLDSYTRAIVKTQAEHTYEGFRGVVERAIQGGMLEVEK